MKQSNLPGGGRPCPPFWPALNIRRAWRPAVLFLFLLFPLLLAAHEGLHEQIVEVTRQIDQNPKNPELYIKRGELYRVHREWKAALADYDRAKRLEPELAVVDLCEGRLHLDAGSPELATAPLDRFLAANPDHAEALLTRARALVKLGKLLEAIRDFSNALKNDVRPELYLERSQAMLAAGPDHANEALAGLDEGIRKLGPVVTLELAAIDLELSRQRYDLALQRLEEVAFQSERKETWLARRGEILEKAGRSEEARKAYTDAMTAIDTLPERVQNTAVMRQLKTRVQKRLTGLNQE